MSVATCATSTTIAAHPRQESARRDPLAAATALSFDEDDFDSDDEEDEDIFEPGYKPTICVRRPAQALSRWHWTLIAPLLCLFTLLPYVFALSLPASVVSIGYTETGIFNFHHIKAQPNCTSPSSDALAWQDTYQRALYIVYPLLGLIMVSFLFSEAYVRSKPSTPLVIPDHTPDARSIVERILNYQTYKGMAVFFWSTAWAFAICIFGVAWGPVSVGAEEHPVQLLTDLREAVHSGNMTWYMCVGIGMVSLDVLWYLWRIHGDRGTYACWNVGGCLHFSPIPKRKKETPWNPSCCACGGAKREKNAKRDREGAVQMSELGAP